MEVGEREAPPGDSEGKRQKKTLPEEEAACVKVGSGAAARRNCRRKGETDLH